MDDLIFKYIEQIFFLSKRKILLQDHIKCKIKRNFCTVNVFRLKSLRFIDRYRKCQRRRLTRRLGANGGNSEVANNHFPLEKDRERS